MSADTVAAPDQLQQALLSGARPTPPSAASSVLTLGWRAMLKIKHVPFQLFDVTAFPLLFPLLFTYLFGGAIAGSPKEYLQYLLPGILVQTVVFLTVYTGVGLNTDISKGLFDRFRSLPMWQPSPVLGALAGDLLRYGIASTIVVLMGTILGFRAGAGVVGIISAVGLVLIFGFAVSWLWIIVGMKVQSPESVMTTSFLLLMPMTFASDIFVPIETLPDWLAVIVRNNPVTHLAAACRGIVHGSVPWSDVWWVLGVSAAVTAIAAPLAMRMYHSER